MRRCLHFVPGGNDKMLDKALTLPADGLILDLEDAVPPDRKEATRPHVLGWRARDFGARERWVRMNPIATGWRADLEQTIAGGRTATWCRSRATRATSARSRSAWTPSSTGTASCPAARASCSSPPRRRRACSTSATSPPPARASWPCRGASRIWRRRWGCPASATEPASIWTSRGTPARCGGAALRRGGRDRYGTNRDLAGLKRECEDGCDVFSGRSPSIRRSPSSRAFPPSRRVAEARELGRLRGARRAGRPLPRQGQMGRAALDAVAQGALVAG